MNISPRKPLTARIGIYGVGHHTYGHQFDGLLEQLENKFAAFEARIHQCGVKVDNFTTIRKELRTVCG